MLSHCNPFITCLQKVKSLCHVNQASADQLHCLHATINIHHQRFIIIIIIIINIHSSSLNTSAWLHYSHHSSFGREKKENQSDGENMWKSFTATQRTHLSSTTTEAERGIYINAHASSFIHIFDRKREY